jgi:FkbM family methyltransferase
MDSVAIYFGEQDLLRHFVDRRGGGVFVDVGANVGTFVAPFARRRWSVLAFEPHPQLHRELRTRFGRSQRVRIVQCAIADKPGELPFYTSSDHPGIHSLAPFHSSHEATAVVRVSTLSDELSRAGLERVTALKIDVEGADLLALKGLDFDHWRPEIAMIEFMDDRSEKHFGWNHHDAAEFMAARGYETWISEWTPLAEYNRAERDDGRPSRWLGLHAYDAADNPAHGNLIFVELGSGPRLEAAANAVEREIRLRATARMIPGLRPLVLRVRSWVGSWRRVLGATSDVASNRLPR